MSELIPYSERGLSRDSRRAGRAITRSRSVTQMRMAHVDDETDVTMQKVEALTSATGLAMSAVTRVAQAQKHLELQTPEVSGRLAFLADAHLLAMGDTLQDLRRQLRNK
ncbi:hypothetical protein [Marmoricola sp. URHB0036]|uniref:hypothetical protein n=1 Tax=Marmoricola sp. URHB0036 TaxID=1298863 RepID=UPI0004893427|nr:hypothetical protein [Marmoricola sp. URHB0036]